MKCIRCKSSRVSKVTQYTVNLFVNDSLCRTEYVNNCDASEDINKRLRSLFNNYEFTTYITGSFYSCDECDKIQDHECITSRKMAYGI